MMTTHQPSLGHTKPACFTSPAVPKCVLVLPLTRRPASRPFRPQNHSSTASTGSVHATPSIPAHCHGSSSPEAHSTASLSTTSGATAVVEQLQHRQWRRGRRRQQQEQAQGQQQQQAPCQQGYSQQHEGHSQELVMIAAASPMASASRFMTPAAG